MIFCSRCGSISHTAYDCSAPDRKLAPPQESMDSGVSTGEGRGPGLNAPTGQNQFAALAIGGEKAPEHAPGLPSLGQPILDPPRWPGGPEICEAENLPAFPDLAAAHAFHRARNRSGSVVNMRGDPWLCGHCGRWHYQSDHAGSHGYADGSGRSGLLPRGFVPFRRAPMRPSAFEGREPALPRQAEPLKRVDLPRRKTLSSSAKREGTLF